MNIFARVAASKKPSAKKTARSAPASESSPGYFAPQKESEGVFAPRNFAWSLANIRIGGPARNPILARTVQPKLHAGKGKDREREINHVAEPFTTSPSAHPVEPFMAPPVVQEVLRSPGQPLDAPTRAYFEPRFGRDLSSVRVHTGAPANAAAQLIGARAYTLGSNIAFAPGEFQPSSEAGRALIAHELAHVVQQPREPGVVRRKINCDPSVKLNGFLVSKGVKNFMQENSLYESPRGGAANFEEEVLTDMLASPRVFNVEGDSDSAAANLNAHVKARTGIVTFASQKKYKFDSGANWSMNRAFYDWNVAKGRWWVKPGVDQQTAWADLNVNPQQYAIGCAAATDITMRGGSGGAPIIDMPSNDPADWIPGDAGYIENTRFNPKKTDIGLLGENIIYTGGGMFWGHFTSQVTFRTLAEWVAEVYGWQHGARIDTKREMPATGLLNK